MTPKQESIPLGTTEVQTRFHLIFDEMAKADSESVSDVSLEEIDEIEQVRRMVMEITGDPPIFMTRT